MRTVLDEILGAKRDEVARLQPRGDEIRAAALEVSEPRDFAAALRPPDGHIAVIAEIKRRSPSKGDLSSDLDAAATAKAYEAGGAAALSVLTDGPFFGGSLEDLRAARDATGLPALRKDFTLDELQVHEARAAGADAVLLIAAALPDDGLLRDLGRLAADLGMAAVVEVHDERELDRALRAGALVVGINSRDLRTFGEDLSVAERLAALVPPEVTAVAESAIRTLGGVGRMADAGFDALLVGEMLVRSPDPGAALAALAAARRRPRLGPEGRQREG